jgi:hypothetical protein
MDLGFVIPMAFVVAVLLLRHPHRPVRLGFAVGGVQMLLCAAVTGMGLVMLIRGDETASVALFVATVVVTLGFAAVYVALLRRVAPRENHRQRSGDSLTDGGGSSSHLGPALTR